MSIVLKLSKSGVSKTEGVELKQDGTWKSPSSGWLKAQEGKWQNVGTTGSRMYDKNKTENIGYLVALLPSTAKKGQKGRFVDEGNGDEGRWEVLDAP